MDTKAVRVDGGTLKYYRERARLSQERLAARAGLTGGAIARIEQGVTEDPGFSTICLLADVLGIPADALRLRAK